MIDFMLKFMLAGEAKKDDEGATAVEYGLLVALIAAVIVISVGVLGGEILAAFDKVIAAIP